MKAISSIFSSLIVTMITLSLVVPLFLYFNGLYENNNGIINQNFNKLSNAALTQLSIINLGNNTSQVYFYNYGKSEITITLIIINNKEYHINVIIKSNEIISLSKIIGANLVLTNSTLIIEMNDNYYYYSIR
ncbi:hypothetical protein EWF20_09055 [Sulfolobus sp. S-194]|uniref:pilin subunit UpsB n=1 Tax=Sulfolobus sp. S-194 TaxID=2512240 RepID=UPI001436FB54|nr:archaellin/type IV pilin N-terminal domain-containing protein [Sulfolobus sp. S-194]QIW24279.1 hypothetical protein EWF20_09055 [Sulfolobus sp. S-194]